MESLEESSQLLSPSYRVNNYEDATVVYGFISKVLVDQGLATDLSIDLAPTAQCGETDL